MFLGVSAVLEFLSHIAYLLRISDTDIHIYVAQETYRNVQKRAARRCTCYGVCTYNTSAATAMATERKDHARRLLIHGTVVTVNAAREILLDGAVLIQNGYITSLGKTPDLLQQHHLEPDISIIDCSGKILIPGLVNTHAHLAQSLLRGLAEDLPLHNWLCDAIWPLEANYAEDDGYVAAVLTVAEMLRTGTTCFLEAMLTHRSGLENVVRAVRETGIRACLVSLRIPIYVFVVKAVDIVTHGTSVYIYVCVEETNKHRAN